MIFLCDGARLISDYNQLDQSHNTQIRVPSFPNLYIITSFKGAYTLVIVVIQPSWDLATYLLLL